MLELKNFPREATFLVTASAAHNTGSRTLSQDHLTVVEALELANTELSGPLTPVLMEYSWGFRLDYRALQYTATAYGEKFDVYVSMTFSKTSDDGAFSLIAERACEDTTSPFFGADPAAVVTWMRHAAASV